ncbi:MAG TPA: phage tail protein, partial [Herbaspirillum sp.]|nr:phage tail protein [Herbaspirillum sp.]
TGYLKANGVAVSRATYAALFAAIGTTFGAGDGSTTFTLPDLRGEFLRAFDDGRGVDSGRTFGSSQTDLFKEHNHRFINEYNTPNMRIVAYSDDNSEGVDSVNTTGLRCWTYISMENTGGSETRPRNIALLACIKF